MSEGNQISPGAGSVAVGDHTREDPTVNYSTFNDAIHLTSNNTNYHNDLPSHLDQSF